MPVMDIAFKFGRGSKDTGVLEYTISPINGITKKLHMERHSYNKFYEMDGIRFSIPKEELYELEKILAPARIWKRRYEAPSEVEEAYNWSIRYEYEEVQIFSDGYGAYPSNWRNVIEELQKFMERLTVQYGGIIDKEEDVQARMKL